MRNIFCRNLYDPYAGAGRTAFALGLLDIMRACLRCVGGLTGQRTKTDCQLPLEHLTRANGIEHSNAHDAMADVYATIAMAKLVKTTNHACFVYIC
ncbi:hypothetical protein KIF59_06610 [Enterobacter cloacae subsp. cloacae]|nr:hypothetical protein [Enterobacter cloacae subsp. cloacae]